MKLMYKVFIGIVILFCILLIIFLRMDINNIPECLELGTDYVGQCRTYATNFQDNLILSISEPEDIINNENACITEGKIGKAIDFSGESCNKGSNDEPICHFIDTNSCYNIDCEDMSKGITTILDNCSMRAIS